MNNTPSDPLRRIKHLKTLLEEGFESTTELVSAFRRERALLSELPAIFEGALESILERLESEALFTEESDSFSQEDLIATLSIWLEKTKSYLEKQLGIVNT